MKASTFNKEANKECEVNHAHTASAHIEVAGKWRASGGLVAGEWRAGGGQGGGAGGEQGAPAHVPLLTL